MLTFVNKAVLHSVILLTIKEERFMVQLYFPHSLRSEPLKAVAGPPPPPRHAGSTRSGRPRSRNEPFLINSAAAASAFLIVSQIRAV